MRTLLLVALLAGTALAGCSGETADPTDSLTSGVDVLPLEADKDTGVIRGIVVDSAVRPIAGASVERNCAGDKAITKTTDLGAFGFSKVPAGTCFVTASKAGYKPSQASSEVRAGVVDPDVVKLQLDADRTTQPYVEVYVFKGFMECGVQSPVLGVALCGLVNDLAGANATNDNTQVTYDLTPGISWVQSEMVWSATNPAGQEMTLLHSWDCPEETLYCDMEATGQSPLLLVENQTNVDILGLNNGTGLYIRVFAEGLNQTRPPTDVCYPNPVLGGTSCVQGVGATVEQGFEIYTHVFHGFAPPEGYRFTVDGPPVVPAS